MLYDNNVLQVYGYRVPVDAQRQQLLRRERELSDTRKELEEQQIYCKKLEAAIAELQSKFADMKAVFYLLLSSYC